MIRNSSEEKVKKRKKMSAAVSGGHHHHHHSGAGTLSLMSCVRESSPPQDGGHELELEKNVSSKKRFWNPRNWFKRKSNKVAEEIQIRNNEEPLTKETGRSRSTSELSVSEEHQNRRRSGTPMHPGLSVSHDSVFHSPHSGSELELENAQSSSSLSIMGHHPTQPDIRLQTELSERLRQRRHRGDTSEDDEGLPRSPCNSPTTTEGLPDKGIANKEHATKSHSTCSDGSLLSMASSEMDEDSFSTNSRYSSSKQSLPERTRDTIDADVTEWGPGKTSAPLNHSAAHHKVSIRPKRKHGPPGRKKTTPVVLPTTPEVNEDMSLRSLSPESNMRENELYISLSYQMQENLNNKMKCSSLPPGLAAPGMDANKLIRSRSNAGTNNNNQRAPDLFPEEEELSDSKKSMDTSFFSRIFPRRSAKKQKKSKEEHRENTINSTTTANSLSTSIIENTYDPFDQSMITVDNNLAIRPNALRAKHRLEVTKPILNEEQQEALLIDDDDSSAPISKAMKHSFNIPPKSPWNEKRQQYTKASSRQTDNLYDSKSVVRIARLSSLQQRVLSLQDEPDLVHEINNFKSLTNLSADCDKSVRQVAKSHSFKYSKFSSGIEHGSPIDDKDIVDRSNIFKSMSLDSIQTVQDKVVESVNQNKVQEMDAAILNADQITISGPSHKAIVSITPTKSLKDLDNREKVSVTKIQFNSEVVHELMICPQKIEKDDTEDVDKNIKTSSIDEPIEEHNEPKLCLPVRKFSNDNIEVIKKDENKKDDVDVILPSKPVMSPITPYFAKSPVLKTMAEKPFLQTRSSSFELETKSNSSKSSQSSLDKMDTNKSQENIAENMVRRRSVVRQKQDDEPELMKVFARRSLKLKDSDSEAMSEMALKLAEVNCDNRNEANNKSRDSDKENLPSSDSSPLEERKKILPIAAPKSAVIVDNRSVDNTEVILRKPVVNVGKLTFNKRNEIVVTKSENTKQKPATILDKPKTDTWFAKNDNEDKPIISEVSNESMNVVTNSAKPEIISCLSEKSHNNINDLNLEPKNFNQRKAEWEKRAQEALRKTMP